MDRRNASSDGIKPIFQNIAKTGELEVETTNSPNLFLDIALAVVYNFIVNRTYVRFRKNRKEVILCGVKILRS